MPIWDIAIIERGGSGDFTLNGNDLAVCESVENAFYLAMFGGNVEADTKLPRTAGVQDFSWWGNALLMGDNPLIQFNSLTERTLNNTTLNSNGRIIIENAIKKDLEFLSSENKVTFTVAIVATDRINVSMKIILPTGGTAVKSFSFVQNPITGDFDLGDFDFSDFF